MAKKSNYYETQLKKGARIEKSEHKVSDNYAKGIARDHLKENINYYKYYNTKSKGVEYLIKK